jgi:hypothetical protein
MYQLMDGAGADYDIQQVLGYVRALVLCRPSGFAIDRRTGRQPTPASRSTPENSTATSGNDLQERSCACPLWLRKVKTGHMIT